ncbi:MAG: DNA topoisomerase 3 [Eubacteriales bacterium]|nr:DNA topoisomerase 3 [Eubacteriales bacterium]MDD3880869.1 DNA topoisomerase 3 [Eubacteriales bacterium]MDD4511764.1 DNA topoisomerase 3 [Eubacteriales bacterium]
MSIVVVAEKPSVGRDIARVLKCRERGEGFIKGEEYTVTWAVGHLVQQVEPDELDEKYKKWRMDDLPILPDVIPVKVIPKTRSQFTVIKKLITAPDCDEVVCATDAGREGEYIFRLIYDKAGCKRPVKRLWISSMTDEAIKEGFDKIKPQKEYDGLYRSAVCRSRADWLVGMNASRAFTLRFDALLSVGRVQTPTLAILVKRLIERRDFVPKQYAIVNAEFGDEKKTAYSGQYVGEKGETQIEDIKKAEGIAARVKGKTGVVRSLESKEKSEIAPQLFDLTALQREANKRLGFTAQKTLKVAQSLYEQYKLLTYPRTDSRYLSHDIQPRIRKTMELLPEEYRQYLPIAQKMGMPVSYKRIFDDAKVSDHHALIPTLKRAELSTLPNDERALYDIVVRRFLAAFAPPLVYESWRIDTDVDGDLFKTTGRIVKDEGWRAIENSAAARKKKDADEEQELALPKIGEGDRFLARAASVKKDATKPPAPHTDASLLLFMEQAGRDCEDDVLRESMRQSGLGTPATRAAVIERLIDVGYAVRKGKTIEATEKGEALINVAPQDITSPETTGKWELALNKIANGSGSEDRFMEGIRRLTSYLVDYAKSAKDIAIPEELRRGKAKGKRRTASGVKMLEGALCPICGAPVQENDKAFGCSKWREGCGFTIWKNALERGGGPAITAPIVKLLLDKKEVRGSTGLIALSGERLSFTKAGEQAPSAFSAIRKTNIQK